MSHEASDSAQVEPRSQTPTPKSKDKWFYPREIAHDLDNTQVPHGFKEECLACAWEYTRCVIPMYTNHIRYMAFVRILVIAIVVEFRGALVDVVASAKVLNYDVEKLLDTLFTETVHRKEMGREFKAWLLIPGDKTDPERRSSALFYRYVTALAKSPRNWFRLRDCDAMARFTIAAALACNDLDTTTFTDPEYEILTELCDTMYDAVAFFKHRAEGETNNTFAYAGEEMRTKCFRICREVLWALDIGWSKDEAGRCVIAFLRNIGGPIHMTMRRYGFVEEELTIGRPETTKVVEETRENVKLWNRVDVSIAGGRNEERYEAAVERSGELMFEELKEMLEGCEEKRCGECKYRSSYGAETAGRFGGAVLWETCREKWKLYLEDFPRRAARVFPFLSVYWPLKG